MRIDQLNGYDEELVDFDEEAEEEIPQEDETSAQDEYGAEWQDDAALGDGASDGLMEGNGGQSVHDGREYDEQGYDDAQGYDQSYEDGQEYDDQGYDEQAYDDVQPTANERGNGGAQGNGSGRGNGGAQGNGSGRGNGPQRSGASRTVAHQTAPERKKNPLGTFVKIFGLLAMLLLLIFFGLKYYETYLDPDREIMVSSKELEQVKSEAQAEAAKKEQEMQERILAEYSQGVLVGERQTLDRIRQSIQGGKSVVETLRAMYSDQLVVGSGGTYHFIPIDETLKMNDYTMNNLVALENGELQYMQGGVVTSYKGIDVSKFQGNIDWAKVAEDGVTFAFIRVGYRGYGENGTMMEDPMAKDNLKGANDAGIKTGAYYYTQAITEEEALQEVEAVLDVIRPYRIDCPVVVDVERVSSASGRMNQLDQQTRTKIVKTFCDAIAAAGYRPMIYFNLEMGAVLLDVSQLEEYDKWFAYYNPDLYYPYAYRVWQYSDKGRVSGISGTVDMNLAFEPLW
ncbi:MAG: glycoside hydrolase family 25 protein [Lachnospiraceae bacterium]|nr:glycoside hydrolase family 25 protein [Lachnospiraceae bacterium]